MAHYAKIDPTNIVTSVHVVADSDENGSEENGIAFLTSVHGDISPSYWKKTSFNTHLGVHKLGGTPLRKNFAGVGSIYDSTKNAFYKPQPYTSWTLTETTCLWEPPTAHPSDGKVYWWDESTTSWKE